MKKALIFIILAGMLLTVSCGGKKPDAPSGQFPSESRTTTENAAAADLTEGESAAENGSEAGNDAAEGLFPIRSVSDADAVAQKIIRISGYDRTETRHGSNKRDSSFCKDCEGMDVYYSLKEENYQPHDDIFTVTLGENERYTIPFSVAELEKNGWVAQDDAGELETDSMSDMVFVNGSGEEIYVVFENLTEETLPASECTVTNLEIDSMDSADVPVRFRIGDLTQEDMTAETIIQKLGAPDAVFFVDADEKCNQHSGWTLIYYADGMETMGFPFSGLGLYMSEETGRLETISLGDWVW